MEQCLMCVRRLESISHWALLSDFLFGVRLAHSILATFLPSKPIHSLDVSWYPHDVSIACHVQIQSYAVLDFLRSFSCLPGRMACGEVHASGSPTTPRARARQLPCSSVLTLTHARDVNFVRQQADGFLLPAAKQEVLQSRISFPFIR